MPDNAPVSARDRFVRELQQSAAAVKCVRNDVYTVKYWQLVIDLVLGAGAIALLVVGMIADPPTSTACIIAGIVAGIAVVLFNVVLRVTMPMSFLQYTAIENGKRYCYQILSKNDFLFCDGDNTVEVDHLSLRDASGPRYPHLRFDFYADMEPTLRIGKPDCDIYKGTLTEAGKTYKCKIVLKSGRPFLGIVGGIRIKYFDINSTKEKFVIPDILRDAILENDIPFPKLPGVFVRDSHTNMLKQ